MWFLKEKALHVKAVAAFAFLLAHHPLIASMCVVDQGQWDGYRLSEREKRTPSSGESRV